MNRVAGVEVRPAAFITPPPATHPRGPVMSFEGSERFASHFFRCGECEIGDSVEQDHFCETGAKLRDIVLRCAPTPQERAYLLHLADEYFEEQWHRRTQGMAL